MYAVRYGAVIVSGMLAALGGAYLSMGFGNAFDQDMTNGRGFIALAAVIFGKWRPYGAFGACLLFGFASAMADRLQSVANISVNLLSTLPYVLTLIALVGPDRPLAPAGRLRAPVRQAVARGAGEPGATRCQTPAARLYKSRSLSSTRGARDL